MAKITPEEWYNRYYPYTARHAAQRARRRHGGLHGWAAQLELVKHAKWKWRGLARLPEGWRVQLYTDDAKDVLIDEKGRVQFYLEDSCAVCVAYRYGDEANRKCVNCPLACRACNYALRRGCTRGSELTEQTMYKSCRDLYDWVFTKPASWEEGQMVVQLGVIQQYIEDQMRTSNLYIQGVFAS